MKTVFLYGTFEGNRGDVLMHHAVQSALSARDIPVTDHADEADVILNICGYWCGDPWGALWSQKAGERIAAWKENGKTIILLPQTFGPFEDPQLRTFARSLIGQCDLVCVRDRKSAAYLDDLDTHADILPFPDYTIDVEPVPSNTFQPHQRSVAIIPNLRMIDKTPTEKSAAYIPFLHRCIAMLQERSLQPFLLIHEEKDMFFADALQASHPELPVVTEPDAQKTKWIIGQSRAVISGRYHGILNALYQNLPVLATGWCHKFPALMAEWGIPEQLIDVRCTDDVLQESLTRLLDGSVKDMSGMQKQYRERTEHLWATLAA
jgi:polysaccharide pyruvyl transferase WcaK-like protein